MQLLIHANQFFSDSLFPWISLVERNIKKYIILDLVNPRIFSILIYT